MIACAKSGGRSIGSVLNFADGLATDGHADHYVAVFTDESPRNGRSTRGLRLTDVPAPEIGTNEEKVRVLLSGIWGPFASEQQEPGTGPPIITISIPLLLSHEQAD